MKKMTGIFTALMIQTNPAGAGDLDALFYRLTVGSEITGSTSADHSGCLKRSSETDGQLEGRTELSSTHFAFNFSDRDIQPSTRSVAVQESRMKSLENECVAEKRGQQTECQPVSQCVTSTTGTDLRFHLEKSSRRFTFPFEAIARYDPPLASFGEITFPVKINRAAKGNRIVLEKGAQK